MDVYSKDSMYHIFFQVVRLHFVHMHSSLEKAGVHPGQPPILFCLIHKDGQSQKELADKIKVKPATMTVTLNRMEKNNLIYRKPDEKDQRTTRVHITEKGKRICNEVKIIMEDLEKDCLKGFTEEEKISLCNLLHKIKDNLDT
ncbi:MarR family transcriptional regulator [Clostridiaceae bacterium 14S0207]|nr:MarR family transcriptional regulator [Clostridiaceae bacterium 14S0207]